MILTAEEKEILDGKKGRAMQRAMELLIAYGEALGAERFIPTKNIHMLVGFHPLPELVLNLQEDDLISTLLLDSGDERINVDYFETFNTTHIWSIDIDQWNRMNAPVELHELMESFRRICINTGILMTATCTPYQIGNIPLRGEHCAWTESSAVPFCNAIMGARTNTETAHSAFCAAITGKIPLSGFHIDENRLAKKVINVECELHTTQDWEMLGYFGGDIMQLDVPAYVLEKQMRPDLNMIKGFNAAGASSGGVQMYHIVGITPEAPTLEAALGNKPPEDVLSYTADERRKVYERLNSAKDPKVDMITLGCPHYSLEQLKYVAKKLDGKKIHQNVHLWIWTAYQLKALADRNGLTETIQKAGAQLFTDACPLVCKGSFPDGVQVVATDAAKQAHYTPGVSGFDVWYGTMEECIDCALTGKWRGELK